MKTKYLINKYLIEKQKHSFHLVDSSPFPFLTSFFLFFFIVPTTFYLHESFLSDYLSLTALFTAILKFIYTLFDTIFDNLPNKHFPQPVLEVSLPEFINQAAFMRTFSMLAYYTILIWFTSILIESQNFHSKKVISGLRFGILLFIISEIMFFFAFFWAFFHFSLNPSIAIGNIWPPYGTQHLDFLALPLVNTILLLSSGITITFAHAYILKNNQAAFQMTLNLTILLGLCFLWCQAYEYKYGVKFSWRNNLYGSIFFLTTGFHGLHVTIGTMALGYCSIRLFFKQFTFTPDHHLGFEASAWYWHFVDVVWLFLYITIYWWGGAIILKH